MCASVVMDLVMKWDSFDVFAVVAVVMFVCVLTCLNVGLLCISLCCCQTLGF